MSKEILTAETNNEPITLSFAEQLKRCRVAGHYIAPMECWNCGGEGVTDHDCGEDVCCCRYSEDNVRCDICDGEGGYEICLTCHPGAAEDGA